MKTPTRSKPVGIFFYKYENFYLSPRHVRQIQFWYAINNKYPVFSTCLCLLIILCWFNVLKK